MEETEYYNIRFKADVALAGKQLFSVLLLLRTYFAMFGNCLRTGLAFTVAIHFNDPLKSTRGRWGLSEWDGFVAGVDVVAPFFLDFLASRCLVELATQARHSRR